MKLSEGEIESKRARLAPKLCCFGETKELVLYVSLATVATAAGGRCGSWVARKASGVRADGGSKFCAFFMSLCSGQQLIFLHVLSALGAAICSPDGNFLIHWWELEDPEWMLMWKEEKRLCEHSF